MRLRLRRTRTAQRRRARQPLQGHPAAGGAVDGVKALAQERERPALDGARGCRARSPAGRHKISLRLANPARHAAAGARCESIASRSSRSAPRGRAVPLARAPRRPSRPPAGIWRPAPGTTWQWQLTTPVDQSVDAADVRRRSLRQRRRPSSPRCTPPAASRLLLQRRLATSTAGPTPAMFPAAVLGSALDGWPDERWLDIRRLDVLGPIMERRLDLCTAQGLRRRRARQRRRLHQRQRLPADRRRPARTTTASWPARRTPAACRSGSRTTSTRSAQLGRLRLGAQRAVLRVRRVRRCCSPSSRPARRSSTSSTTLDPTSFCAQAKAQGISAIRKNLDLDASREAC